jgi:beta-glucosidase
MLTPANRQAAREIARQSMVLLKNEKQQLPLPKTGIIAVIGPLADNRHEILGTWGAAGEANKSVTVTEGIKNIAGDNVKILYARGCNLLTDLDLLKRISGAKQADPRNDDEMIREAVETAAKADIIVAVLGEPKGITGEANSRSEIGIPGRQLDLLKALAKTGKPIVLVLINGRPLTLEWENSNIPAILEAWHAGTETGNAVADILFGNYNPSGKLSMTFPRNVGQIPIYYNVKNTGRPWKLKPNDYYDSHYIDVSNEPLYPFGFGLSYTSFTYSDLSLDKSVMTNTSALTVSCTITNSGKYDGTEVVQLYTRDMVGSITRPVKELKDFQKIFLKAGESKTIHFKITADQLAFYNEKLQLRPEPGDFKVFVGGNSVDVKEAGFRLE